MTTVDTSLYGQIQPIQIQQQNPLAMLAAGSQLQAHQLAAQKDQMAIDQQNSLLQVANSPEFQQLDTQGKVAALQKIGAFPQAGSLVTTDAAAKKDSREADKTKLEMQLKQFDAAANIAGTVRDQPSYERGLGMMKSLGFDTSNWSTQYNPDGVAQFAQSAISQKDKVAQQLQAAQFGEAYRHNVAGEQNQAGQLAVSQGNLGVAQGRLAFEKDAPKGQVVQTDEGTMLVDPRTGGAQPVTDASGQPLQKPGRNIPPAVNKSIIENQQTISKIDSAIAAIGARPKALGPINAIPGVDALRQYTDPEGIDARAGVADVGSQIFHDRSGANVTISEAPRLKPFVPTSSDSPDAALTKLKRLRQFVSSEAGLLEETYSKDQGYKESPVFKAGAANRKAPAASDTGGLEAEMRRRGLLK